MKLLAFDTTGEVLSAALASGAKILGERRVRSRNHDEHILGAARSLLKREGWTLRDLDAFTVASGPGRFTGMRVGMACGLFLARGLGRPIVPVSRFEATAFTLPEGDGSACVAYPALRDELFFQVFTRSRRGWRAACDPRWVRSDEVKDAVSGCVPRGADGPFFCGPAAHQGAAAYGEGARVLEGATGEVRARDLVGPALELLRSGKSVPCVPLYLKPWRGQKRRVG